MAASRIGFMKLGFRKEKVSVSLSFCSVSLVRNFPHKSKLGMIWDWGFVSKKKNNNTNNIAFVGMGLLHCVIHAGKEGPVLHLVECQMQYLTVLYYGEGIFIIIVVSHGRLTIGPQSV
jgi:hypothetical protein